MRKDKISVESLIKLYSILFDFDLFYIENKCCVKNENDLSFRSFWEMLIGFISFLIMLFGLGFSYEIF